MTDEAAVFTNGTPEAVSPASKPANLSSSAEVWNPNVPIRSIVASWVRQVSAKRPDRSMAPRVAFSLFTATVTR